MLKEQYFLCSGVTGFFLMVGWTILTGETFFTQKTIQNQASSIFLMLCRRSDEDAENETSLDMDAGVI
jgi:hypothetical protein